MNLTILLRRSTLQKKKSIEKLSISHRWGNIFPDFGNIYSYNKNISVNISENVTQKCKTKKQWYYYVMVPVGEIRMLKTDIIYCGLCFLFN